jgi:hypothetical protein
VRRGARWALGLSASLIAMGAISGARADVRSIDLDECASCLSPAADEAAAAEDEAAGDVTPCLFGGGGTEGATDARPDLIFDPKAVPRVLVSGLPSPITDVAADTPESEGVSPYAFFAEVIDLPLSVDPHTRIFASIRLFAPSLIGRVTLTDLLSDSRELFRPLPPRPPQAPAM